MSLKNSAAGYDSAFEEDIQLRQKQRERNANVFRERPQRFGLPNKSILLGNASNEDGKRLRYQMTNLTAYERHKLLINNYVLYHPGSTSQLQRDTSRDKRDIDVIQENHQFLWDSKDSADTWERQLAKKYYDKLFKEYCICDLSRYKENKVGMRWRIEMEVIEGKGQFSCGEKRCKEVEDLRTWEMNFGYVELGIKKNALIKLRLCRNCSYKVNYHHKRKEVTKKSRDSHKRKLDNEGGRQEKHPKTHEEEKEPEESSANEVSNEESESNIWKGPAAVTEEKSRDEEFEEYLEDLFL